MKYLLFKGKDDTDKDTLVERILKKFLTFINEDCINFYLKLYFRRRLKYKSLKKTDSIDHKYRSNILEYWSQFNVKVNLDWHIFYSCRNNIRDVRYIPEDLFYSSIEPFYNKRPFSEAMSDKALYKIFFPNVKLPITLVKNMSGVNYDDNFRMISFEEVVRSCVNENHIIIKPTINSGGGKGIIFIKANNPSGMEKKIVNSLNIIKNNYVIQEYISQHGTLKQLNPTSVNTVRIMSFLHNNQVTVLPTSHIRIGIDNLSYDHFGIVVGINKEGYLGDYAVRYKQGDVFDTHPQGYSFKGVLLPGIDEMKNIAKREHIKFGHFKLISWDFAVDKEGTPILIEINLLWQGLNHHQLTNGPLFGNLTDIVLEEVFGKKQV